MKKFILIFSLLFAIQFNAQTGESLSSDRPGQALSSSVVGKNVFQIQAGIDYFKNADVYLPNSYFRYGISDKVEINSGLAYFLGDGKNNLAGFNLGTRISLSKKESNISSAIQISATLPVENLNFGTQAIYTIAGNFTDNLGWTANIGANFDEDFKATGLYVFNLSYSISDKIGIFLEPFGTFGNGSSFAFDTGFYYLVNNDFQLDFLIGDNNGLFLGLGATIRFLPKQ